MLYILIYVLKYQSTTCMITTSNAHYFFTEETAVSRPSPIKVKHFVIVCYVVWQFTEKRSVLVTNLNSSHTLYEHLSVVDSRSSPKK